MSGWEQGWGLQVVLWFQSWRTPLIGGAGLAISLLGNENFWLIALALVYWCLDTRFGRRLALLYIGQSWFNTALKEAFGRPRPPMVSSQVRPLAVENSPGLPSGHSQTAAGMGGVIALEARRSWVTILVVVIMALTALARLVIGVHYPQDVITGLIIGLALAGAYAWLEPGTTRWLARQSLWMQIGLSVAAGLLMLIVHPLLIHAAYPEDFDNAVSGGAAVIGVGVGIALEMRFVRFSEKGAGWKMLARFLLGVALLLAIRFGLAAAFSPLGPVWLWRVIRYTCLGLGVSWLAPWLFVRLGLAERRGA